MVDHTKKLNYQTVFLIDEELRNSHINGSEKVEDTVNLIRCSLLRILTYFGNASCDYEESENLSTVASNYVVNLEWGVKFFSSASRDEKHLERVQFMEYNLKQFEDFEMELEARLIRPFAGLGKLVKSEEEKSNLFGNLQAALERLMYDFPWDRPDITSPVKLRRTSYKQPNKRCRFNDDDDDSEGRRNFVFIVAKCPHTMHDLQTKAHCENSASSVLKSILLHRVCREFSEVRHLRLFWLDVNTQVSGDVSGLKLVSDALELVHGGVVSVGSILSLGILDAAYIHSLLKYSGEVPDTAFRKFKSVDVEKNALSKDCQQVTTIGLTLPFMSSLSHLMKSLKSLTCFEKELESVLILDNGGLSICHVMIQKLLAHSAGKSGSEKEHVSIASHSENTHIVKSHLRVSFPSGIAPKTTRTSSGSLCTPATLQAFSAVATLSGEVFSMLALQGEDDVYLVMGPGKRADSNKEPQFEDLLMHLAMTGKCLVVCSQGSSNILPSSFGFLRPLTSVSATLMFLHSAVGLTLDQLLRSRCNFESHQENDQETSHESRSQIIREIIEQLPCVDSLKLSPAADLRTSCKRISTASFHPLLLERWFAPECIAESNDSLLSAICRDNTDQGADTERNLLHQLQEHCNSKKVRNHKNNSVLTSPESSVVGFKVVASGQDFKNDHRKAGAVRDLDTRKAADDNNCSQKTRFSLRGTPRKSFGRTPEKASKRSPRKTPGKTPRKTPRKSPRKSPKNVSDVAAFKTLRRSSPTKQREQSLKASSSRMTFSGLKRQLSLRSGDVDRRLSLGVAVPTSRTELIIQKSKEALARKNQLEKEQESQNAARNDQKGSTQSQKHGQVTTTGWQELHSVDELLSHLKTMYTKVAEGEGSPMIGAKSIFSSALQFFQNQCDDTAQTSACCLLRDNLRLSSFKVKERYKGKSDAAALECKFREFLLQVCLQFEMNSEAEADENSEDVASELASMLSSVAIVKGANFLSTYLNDLLESYLDSSSKLLFHIHENLGRSAPPQLQHLLSPDHEDEDRTSLPPPSTQWIPSASSAASNNSNENVQQKKRSFYRYPTFNPVPMKQILLEPKNLKNITRRSARIASSSKLNVTQVADQVETKRVKRTLFGGSGQTTDTDVRRRLSLPPDSLSSLLMSEISCSMEKPRLRSPNGACTPAIKAHHVLKTRKVSETPVHKQGRNSISHKMERLRRQSNIQPEGGVEVVEESPMKPSPDRNVNTRMTGSMKSDGQERMKRRASFYSTTAAAQSRNVNRYKRLEDRMTQQETSPSSPERPPVPTNSKVLMTSPRRITARVLFGLSPSPCKRIIGPHCSKDATGTPKFASPLNGSMTTSTLTTNLGIDPTSTKLLESFGIKFLESPAKFSAVDPGVISFTSPAKNTRLQARLESHLPTYEQTKETLISIFMSTAKEAQQEVGKDCFLSPAKSTRLQARLDRDRHVSSSQSRVDFSNFISPTKGRVACTQLDFSSPAKNTRFQARQESGLKSKGTSTLQILDENVACSSPPRTESSFQSTTPTSKILSSAATESPVFCKGSPTFGSCKQRTTTDSSPVFSSGKGCSSNFAEINFASKRSSPEISGNLSKCSVKRSERKSKVESPVHHKAKKRLLWSPDSGNARKKFCQE